MNSIEIGTYIKRKRIEKNMTQRDLAEQLNISFQAVSKWETGTTLPDTSILLALSDILVVSVDQILNAGEFRERMNKQINVEEVKKAIKSILYVKKVLGPNNGIVTTMFNALNEGRDTSFEEDILDPNKREILLAKSVIQLIIDGYNISEADLVEFFPTEMIRGKVQKYQEKYSQ